MRSRWGERASPGSSTAAAFKGGAVLAKPAFLLASTGGDDARHGPHGWRRVYPSAPRRAWSVFGPAASMTFPATVPPPAVPGPRPGRCRSSGSAGLDSGGREKPPPPQPEKQPPAAPCRERGPEVMRIGARFLRRRAAVKQSPAWGGLRRGAKLRAL